MAKKEYREVPVEELTEEQLKRWFQRLRELYKSEQHHVHEIKVERWQLRNERFTLFHEIKVLKRENRLLKEEIEKIKKDAVRAEKKAEKKEKKEKKEKAVKSEVVDFKKKFFDSL